MSSMDTIGKKIKLAGYDQSADERTKADRSMKALKIKELLKQARDKALVASGNLEKLGGYDQLVEALDRAIASIERIPDRISE